MPSKQFNSLKEFYPFYLTEHLDSVCRRLHLIGTGLVIGLFLAGLVSFNWRFFALMPLVGYGFSWAGHFFFERNKPAAFSNPYYSLASDFIMFWHTISGKLPKVLEEAKKAYPKG